MPPASRILSSASECEDAVNELLSAGMLYKSYKYASGSPGWSTVPKACYKDGGGWYFNQHYSGTTCTSVFPCILKNDQPSGCTDCQTGRYQDEKGQFYCDMCSSGNFLDKEPGANVCFPCADGKYSSSITTSCTTCSAGTYSRSGQTACTPCPTRYYSSSGAYECSTCETGRYYSASQNTCYDCGVGNYQDQTGQNNCKACAPGQWQSSPGQSSCINCLPGEYQSGSGYTSCTACPAGQYQDSYGSISCNNCEAGKFNEVSGESACYWCTEQYGNTQQKGCMTSPAGSNSASKCSFLAEAVGLGRKWSSGYRLGNNIQSFTWKGWQDCFNRCVTIQNCEFVMAYDSKCYTYTSGSVQYPNNEFWEMTCNSW